MTCTIGCTCIAYFSSSYPQHKKKATTAQQQQQHDSGMPKIPARRDQQHQQRLLEPHSNNKENLQQPVCDKTNTASTAPTEQHVQQLIREGHDKNSVERALVIAQNNLDMAREILRNFVPKS